MTDWFVDANVFLALFEPENAEHEASRELLAGDGTVGTLDLAYHETANVTVRRWRRPELAQPAALFVSTCEIDGKLVRVDEPLMTAAVGIADRYGISAYDAAYAAAAQRAGKQLVSCDVQDLVDTGLAITPTQAVAVARADEGSDDG